MLGNLQAFLRTTPEKRVTFASNAIANSVTQSSGTYQVEMPTAAGSYTYQCTIHPTQMNGSGTGHLPEIDSGEPEDYAPDPTSSTFPEPG